jgi:hypothetical protein
LIVVLVLVSLSLFAQTPAPYTVRGLVIDGASGAVLRRAQVSVTLAAAAVRPVLTDDNGSFAIAVPSGGSPSLRVSKAGYTAALVQPTRGSAVEIRLARSASIAGRVIDRAGIPVPSVLVNARRESSDGSVAPPQASASSDVRGEYRFGGLAAGRYVVTVVQSPERPPARDANASRQFFEQLRDGVLEQPLTGISASTTLELRAGDSLEGHDLVVDTRPPCNWALNPPRPEDTGTATVEGRVVGSSGPLECMLVRLIRPGVVRIRSVATDANGQFSFPRLWAGTYTLQAVGWGYTQRDYGQRANEPGRSLTLRDGEKVNGLVIRLPPVSLVTGTVRDEYGEPAEGVQILAFEVAFVDGRQIAQGAGQTRATTDDRGRFRLFPLFPGSYVLSATRAADVSGADLQGGLRHPPVYFPGTPDSSLAEHVRVDIGQDVEGMDFALASSIVARVSGIALTADGGPLTGSVRLATSQRSGGLIMPPRMTPVGADGTFSFADVPRGDYVVQAIGRATGDFGLAHVRVSDSESVRVTITALPSSTIEGRLVTEGAEVGTAGFVVASVSTDFDFARMDAPRPTGLSMQPDGTFRVAGLSGPMRFTLLTAPDGWYLKTVLIEGISAADTSFDFGLAGKLHRDVEIVVSSAGGVVIGRVVDRRGEPAADALVIVYSVNRGDWFATSSRVRLTRVEPDATFRVAGLPPGEYWVAAVDRLDAPAGSGQWQQPSALEELTSAAQRLRVGERQTVTAALRVGSR